MRTTTSVRRIGLTAIVLALTLGPRLTHGQDPDIRLVKVAEVQRMLGQGRKLLLVDVRTNQEFLARHIKGAVSVPLNTIGERHGELPRQGLVVLY